MKVMSRESENGEEGEISVVKEASHDVRYETMERLLRPRNLTVADIPLVRDRSRFRWTISTRGRKRGYLSSIEVEIHDENNDGQERTVLAFIA